MEKSFLSTGTERSERLLLDSIEKDRNHQVSAQLGGRRRTEELLPEIAERRFAQCE
jgi:hypothetical protein